MEMYNTIIVIALVLLIVIICVVLKVNPLSKKFVIEVRDIEPKEPNDSVPEQITKIKRENRYKRTITIGEIARSKAIKDNPKTNKLKNFRYVFEKIRTLANKNPSKCPKIKFKLKKGDIHFNMDDLLAMRKTLIAGYSPRLQKGQYNYSALRFVVETGIEILDRKRRVEIIDNYFNSKKKQ